MRIFTAAALLAIAAGAASPALADDSGAKPVKGRVITAAYQGAGGVSEQGSTIYQEVAGDQQVGSGVATSQGAERGVAIQITDASGKPVAARVEVLSTKSGRGMVQEVCAPKKATRVRLHGEMTVRVTLLVGSCTDASGAEVTSVPTSGTIAFSFR